MVQKFYEQLVVFDLKDESVFAPSIDKVMKRFPNVYIKSLPKPYGTSRGIRVWVSARGNDDVNLKTDVENAISALEEATGVASKLAEK